MVKKYTLTPEGFEKLENELKSLEKDRPSAVAKLKHAREMGDLSENNAYSAAREKLNYIDHRMDEIKAILISAKIAEKSANKNIISLGSKVNIKTDSGKIAWSIVSELESDLSANKISDVSPIGKALMGKKKGDKVVIDIPSGKVIYEILEIK